MRKLKENRTDRTNRTSKTHKEDSKEEELRAQLARCLADYRNLVNRVERERSEVVVRANKELVANFLAVLDNLTRCQGYLRDEGLGMAIVEFERVLREAGVSRIEVKKGDRFDEETCEASEVVDLSTGHSTLRDEPSGLRLRGRSDSRSSDSKSSGEDTGTVAEITREGYKWSDGTVLRVARVKVYK